MARYERSYSGKRRTDGLHMKLTPSERAELEAAVAGQGATLSVYACELLFRRSAAVVAGTRRNPEAKALADELRAIGINLNQIARHANTTGELADQADQADQADELYAALTAVKAATARVIAL